MYDPRPDSEEEEWAQKYGITPLMLPTGDKLYLGLAAINSVGEEDVIPVFDLGRQEFLEYDISKLVYNLSREKKPVVGILSSLDIQGEPEQMRFPGRPPAARKWVLTSQLSKFAKLEYLPKDTAQIGSQIDVLLVIHPKNLPEQTRYAIDQFAVKGGSIFVAVDPYCASDQPKTDPSNPLAAMTADRSSNLKGLLSNWGAELIEKKIVGDLNLGAHVSTGQDREPELFPVWLSLASASNKEEIINRNDAVTGQLENVMFAWSGALTLKNVEGIKVEPLLQTSTQAMLYDEQDIRFSGENPQELLKKFTPGMHSYVIAARITGKLKSSFPGKPGAAEDKDKKVQNMSAVDSHMAEGAKEAHVIVAADVDFLADQ